MTSLTPWKTPSTCIWKLMKGEVRVVRYSANIKDDTNCLERITRNMHVEGACRPAKYRSRRAITSSTPPGCQRISKRRTSIVRRKCQRRIDNFLLLFLIDLKAEPLFCSIDLLHIWKCERTCTAQDIKLHYCFADSNWLRVSTWMSGVSTCLK